MIRLSVIVVLLAVGAPLDAHAGDIAAYAALAHLYRSGRRQDATTQLAAWPHNEVASAVKAAAAEWTPAEPMVAAILHADTANVLLDARPDDAAFLFDTGYTLVPMRTCDFIEVSAYSCTLVVHGLSTEGSRKFLIGRCG